MIGLLQVLSNQSLLVGSWHERGSQCDHLNTAEKESKDPDIMTFLNQEWLLLSKI